ncbi:MAG: diaminopimelate epimerase [Ignavibacteriales bacterium]|nr:diaminopimelate epimerase [Ignavibacteriales bacterium]
MPKISIDFVKMTGAGNDFVLVDNRESRYNLDWVSLSTKLTDRRYGIGADGLLVIEKSTHADFQMNYFNADGSYGGMCGNGGRCSALFGMNLLQKSEITFEALNHIYNANLLNDKVLLRMKDPHSIKLNQSLIDIEPSPILYNFIDTGAPHVVIFENYFDIDILMLGKQIRNHKTFTPSGANVNFVMINQDKSLSIRTYERGVEAETFACGTGSIAAAIVYSLKNNIKPPIDVHTKSNEILTVNFEMKEDKFANIILTGSAKIVYSGVITINI